MTFNYTKKNPYEDANVIKAANDKAAHEATKLADWTGGTYGQSVQNALDKINNREKFTYDLNGDMLYQQYKDQYINAGKMAMADTMGQAAALTGGYGNSYAATVGNQAYQGYLQQLNNKVPELYQLAYDRYRQEGQDLKDQYSLYRDMYNTEYGEYRDKVSDWNTQQNRLDSLWAAALEHATNESNTDYNNAFARYQQDIAEQQWNKSFELSKANGGGSGSGSGGNSTKETKLDRYTLQANGNEDGTYTYKNSAGKTKTTVLGQNPYTGGYNADILDENGKADKNKIIKNSTYQPNNVSGYTVHKSGEKTSVKGNEVNIWYTTDKSGNKQYWIWDGENNRYRPYDLKTDTYL